MTSMRHTTGVQVTAGKLGTRLAPGYDCVTELAALWERVLRADPKWTIVVKRGGFSVMTPAG